MFHYTVRAVHDPNIEIVLEPLKKESLNLAPFVVREVTVRHSAFGGDKKVTEVILLTRYLRERPSRATNSILRPVLLYAQSGIREGWRYSRGIFSRARDPSGPPFHFDRRRPQASRQQSNPAGRPRAMDDRAGAGLGGDDFLSRAVHPAPLDIVVHGETQNAALDPAGQGPNAAGFLARYSIDGPGFRRRSAAVLRRSLPVRARVSRSIAGNRCLKPDSG